MAVITPERYILALRKTPVVLKSLLKGVSQEQAGQMTDGPDGWSVVQTMCHIRDIEEVMLTRARLILEQDNPTLPNFDPGENAKRRDYVHKQVTDEFAAYLASRKVLIALISGLSEEQWQRRGNHANLGNITLLELMVQVTWHDLNHMEQIARSLQLSEPLIPN